MSQQINLFNPLFRPRGFSFTSAQAMLYAIGIAAGLIAALAVYGDYELRQVAARAQAIDSAHTTATERLAKITEEVAQQKPSAQIEADIATLEAQLKGRQEVVETLRSGVVGNTAGFSEYMRAFSRQAVNGLWLTGFDINGNDLTLSGRTVNPELVAGFLKQLNREPVLQGREFSALRIQQPPADDTADVTANTEPDKGQKDTRDTKSAAPRYLEFSISTAPLPEEPQRTVARPQPATQRAQTRSAPPDTAKAIEAAKAILSQDVVQ